jgi:Ca-activated chloride channel family protein
MWPTVRSRARVRLAGLAVAGAVTMAPLGARQQPTVFRAGTQTVPVYTTVLGPDGRLVTDLTKDDFDVYDDGRAQPITVFANDIQPISIVVMLDTSGSMTGSIALLKEAAEQFLLRLLPADQGRVGAFNDKIQIMGTHFTKNRDELISEVRELDYGNGTKLWDAALASLDELHGIEGRRVVLVFTDGDDTESRAHLGNVIDKARVDDAMVYAIGLQSNYFNGQRMVRSEPDGGLRKIADETGGGYFELKKTADLAPTFTRVAQELHAQYVMGFAPTELDGKVHKLSVRIRKPGMTARARRSYLAAPDKYTISPKP